MLDLPAGCQQGSGDDDPSAGILNCIWPVCLSASHCRFWFFEWFHSLLVFGKYEILLAMYYGLLRVLCCLLWCCCSHNGVKMLDLFVYVSHRMLRLVLSCLHVWSLVLNSFSCYCCIVCIVTSCNKMHIL